MRGMPTTEQVTKMMKEIPNRSREVLRARASNELRRLNKALPPV